MNGNLNTHTPQCHTHTGGRNNWGRTPNNHLISTLAFLVFLQDPIWDGSIQWGNRFPLADFTHYHTPTSNWIIHFFTNTLYTNQQARLSVSKTTIITRTCEPTLMVNARGFSFVDCRSILAVVVVYSKNSCKTFLFHASSIHTVRRGVETQGIADGGATGDQMVELQAGGRHRSFLWMRGGHHEWNDLHSRKPTDGKVIIRDIGVREKLSPDSWTQSKEGRMISINEFVTARDIYMILRNKSK